VRLERDEWEAWLDRRRAEHTRLSAEIVRLETALTLFDLAPDEICNIEESTKYEYGEL
jgi:hypothetical protein